MWSSSAILQFYHSTIISLIVFNFPHQSTPRFLRNCRFSQHLYFNISCFLCISSMHYTNSGYILSYSHLALLSIKWYPRTLFQPALHFQNNFSQFSAISGQSFTLMCTPIIVTFINVTPKWICLFHMSKLHFAQKMTFPLLLICQYHSNSQTRHLYSLNRNKTKQNIPYCVAQGLDPDSLLSCHQVILRTVSTVQIPSLQIQFLRNCNEYNLLQV